MGVEYRHYVIPAEPLRRPSAERIVELAQAMEAGAWLLSPKSEIFRTMCAATGNFDEDGAHRSARETGASYDGERCERWGPGTPLPYPLDPEWLRAKKRAIKMTWPIEQVFELGLRYPLTQPPHEREWAYFKLQLHWSRYILQLPDAAPPRCRCGESLSLPGKGGRAIGPFLWASHTTCPTCDAPFDAKHTVGLYRFALVVDCGKSVPESGGRCALHPELRALLERVVGGSFYEEGVVC